MSSADLQNLIYALIQVSHNFGAVLINAIAAYGLWRLPVEVELQRRAAVLLFLAWALQVAGGIGFGATSFYFYHHFPDIHGLAIDALGIKVVCAVGGILISGLYYLMSPKGWLRHARPVWGASLALGCIALSAAAFLRWFS